MSGRGALFAWLGLAGIVFALLAFALQLLSVGAVRLPWSEGAMRDFATAFMTGNALLGAVFLAAAAFSDLPLWLQRQRAGEGGRSGRYAMHALLQAVLGLCILALLAHLAARYEVRWDWTETRAHSLSQQSADALAALPAPAEATALLPDTGAGANLPALLERYAAAGGGNFSYKIVLANEQPTELSKLGIASDQIGDGLLHLQVGAESTRLSEFSEQALTNALLGVARGGAAPKKLYLLSGHGEAAFEGDAAGAALGLGQFADALRRENYALQKLRLITAAAVPEDAAAVVVAGPQQALHPNEVRALTRWVQGGGALLALLDPRVNSGLEPVFGRWGAALGDDVVVDRGQSIAGQPLAPVATDFAEHEITGGFAGRDSYAVFYDARSVAPADGGAFSALLNYGASSWAERDMQLLVQSGEAAADPEQDLVGNVPAAAVGEVGARNARVAVFGDSDFARNQLFAQGVNRDLLLNTAAWLLGEAAAITIRPELPRPSRLALSQTQFETLRVLALFVVPELIALFGLVVAWRRRTPRRRKR